MGKVTYRELAWVCYVFAFPIRYALTTPKSCLLGVGGSGHTAGVISNGFRGEYNVG